MGCDDATQGKSRRGRPDVWEATLPPLDSFAPDEALSIERVARYLGVSAYLVGRIPVAELPRLRVGKRFTYTAHDLRTYVARSRECGTNGAIESA